MTWLFELFAKTPPWAMPLVITVVVLFLLFYVGRAVWRAWPTIKLFVFTVIAIGDLTAFMKRTDDRFDTQAGQFTTMADELAKLRKQVENDHKTNLRDDITDAQETAKRVEKGVRSLHIKHANATRANKTRFDQLDKQIAELHTADATLREDLERTQPKPQPTEGES